MNTGTDAPAPADIDEAIWRQSLHHFPRVVEVRAHVNAKIGTMRLFLIRHLADGGTVQINISGLYEADMRALAAACRPCNCIGQPLDRKEVA